MFTNVFNRVATEAEKNSRLFTKNPMTFPIQALNLNLFLIHNQTLETI